MQARLERFSFVFIPVDVDTPLEEWDQEQPEGKEVECLTQRLQEYFRQTTTPNAASKEAVLAQLKANGVKIPDGEGLSDDLVEAMAGMQLVESIPLQSGNKDNGFVHVNLYCDDSGTAKGLPNNPRASAISEQCGVPRSVHGDVFVGRLIDDGNDLFTRLNFTLAEMSTDAEWMQRTKSVNLSKNTSEQIQQMQQLAGPGASVVTPETHAAVIMDEDVPVEEGSYTWTQDNDEVEIRVLCPACTKAKDVKCTIKSKSIALGIATLPNPEVLQGNFSATVDPDDTNWSIENSDGRRLVRVTIAKANAGQSWAELMAPN